MRHFIASAAAAILLATAAPAFAKGHDAPSDTAEAFGQPNADEKYVIGGETAAVDAKKTDGEPGLDGSEQSSAAQMFEREPANPPKGKPE